MPNGTAAVSSRRWLLLAIGLALVPVYGLFSTSRIFFVRDLSFFFWSRHLWLRHTIFAWDVPWWDPHIGGGQSAIADALNQLVMPVTLAIRLLPSDVVSFNLWVGLPLPVAAAGMFLFLRQRLSPTDKEWSNKQMRITRLRLEQHDVETVDAKEPALLIEWPSGNTRWVDAAASTTVENHDARDLNVIRIDFLTTNK